MMKKHGWWIITLAIIAALVALLVVQARKPGKYDEFAQCVADSGTKFYGAWWCPHCQAQKAIFGKSSRLLPYVECQTKNRDAIQICIDADIKGFPTWDYPDGSRVVAEQSFEELAAKTSCLAPSDTK